MEIKDFIKSTLAQIREAMQESSDELQRRMTLTTPRETAKFGNIEFDLAVTASNTTSSGQKGGLKIHIAEAGLDKETSTTSNSTSRIKFSISADFYSNPNDQPSKQPTTVDFHANG